MCAEISFGDARQGNASVTSGKVFLTAHAVFFPRPVKAETVSQPVIAWNTGSDLDFSGPRHARSSCAAM